VRRVPGTVDVSVVVPSHGRTQRLRWLLNALEDQTLAERWEVVVAHDYDPQTARHVFDCPLARAGRVRDVPVIAAGGTPAPRKRNEGWRAARGELVAFTDDDCRPDPRWLERLVAAARAAPGQVVQGTTRPDPLEAQNFGGPHARSLWIDPVNPYLETCNILYPRALLEQLGGFDERAITGEDCDLAVRARQLGRTIVAAPDAVVFHAVESFTLPGIVRRNVKWSHLPYLLKIQPSFRSEMSLRYFWDDEHLRSSAALAGVLASRWRREALALALPYVLHASRRRGPAPRRRLVALAELPGQAIRQFAEVVGMAVGSVRYRSPLL
jgi:GT2 family glycosyltransferase